MRLNKLFLIGAVALGIGLTACNNDEVPNPDQQKGTTYVGLTLKFPKSSATTRALPDDYNQKGTWDGRDVIKKINVYMVNTTDNTITKNLYNDVNQFYEITSEGELNPKLAVEATAGKNVKAYVVVNGLANTITTLDGANDVSDFETKFKAVEEAVASQVATYDTSENKETVMMTNTVTPTPITVIDGVTKAQAIAGQNQMQVEVERVVARAMLTIAAKATSGTPSGWIIKDEATGLQEIGRIVDAKYSVGQSNKNFYIMKKSDYEVPDPVYGYVPNGNWSSGKDNFDYSEVTNYSSIQVSTDATNPVVVPLLNSETTSKFVLPVTHADGDYRKGNVTYFEVRAIFVPTGNLADGAYTAGDPLYYGVTDKKFYSTRANAEAMEGGKVGDKNQQAIHYQGDGSTGAIMKYVLWLNPDHIPGVVEKPIDLKTTKSPTVRNQVYHARISGFKAIGVPNNPLNPDDPKDPENPDNPIDPDDPLETEKTYLSVKVSVLDWGVHSYEVEAGQNY